MSEIMIVTIKFDGGPPLFRYATPETTAREVLHHRGLKGYRLLPAGQFPPVPASTRLASVKLDPESVALAGADFVAVPASECRKVARLQRKLVGLLQRGPSAAGAGKEKR